MMHFVTGKTIELKAINFPNMATKSCYYFIVQNYETFQFSFPLKGKETCSSN